MIQAAAVSTPQAGIFTILKSILFSGGSGASTRIRRQPDAGERAALQAIRDRLGRLDDTECSYSDEELVAYMVGNVIEPLQAMVRKVADQWEEPHLGRLTMILDECCATTGSLDELLIDRADFLESISGWHYDLGLLARGIV